MTGTLTVGRSRDRAPAPLWGWIQTQVRREGGWGVVGSGTLSPLVPSTGSPQARLQTPGGEAVREVEGPEGWWGKGPLGSWRGEQWEMSG